MKKLILHLYDNKYKSILFSSVILLLITACVAQRVRKKPETTPIDDKSLDVTSLPKPLSEIETYDLITYTLNYEGEEYVVIEKNGTLAICKK